MLSSENDDALPGDEAPAAPQRPETALGAGVVLIFAASWIVAAGACFALVDGGGGRFLDVPIAALLGGQGLLMLLVVLTMKLFRA